MPKTLLSKVYKLLTGVSLVLVGLVGVSTLGSLEIHAQSIPNGKFGLLCPTAGIIGNDQSGYRCNNVSGINVFAINCKPTPDNSWWVCDSTSDSDSVLNEYFFWSYTGGCDKTKKTCGNGSYSGCFDYGLFTTCKTKENIPAPTTTPGTSGTPGATNGNTGSSGATGLGNTSDTPAPDLAAENAAILKPKESQLFVNATAGLKGGKVNISDPACFGENKVDWASIFKINNFWPPFPEECVRAKDGTLLAIPPNMILNFLVRGFGAVVSLYIYVASLLIVIAGIFWNASGINPSMATTAKTVLKAFGIGLIGVLFSWPIIITLVQVLAPGYDTAQDFSNQFDFSIPETNTTGGAATEKSETTKEESTSSDDKKIPAPTETPE